MKNRKRVVIIVLAIIGFAIFAYVKISRHVAAVNDTVEKVRELRQKVIDHEANQ